MNANRIVTSICQKPHTLHHVYVDTYIVYRIRISLYNRIILGTTSEYNRFTFRYYIGIYYTGAVIDRMTLVLHYIYGFLGKVGIMSVIALAVFARKIRRYSKT